MLSFGWSEIALVAVIIVIVVGPKEIPNLLKQLGSLSKSLRKISRQFKSSLNELAEEGDLKDVKKSLSDIKDIKNDLDPTKAINKELKEEIETIKKATTFTDKEISEINSKIKKD
tara:strand:+ start:281 stop:625 length:345 start_codon:yes stop_codon:yes gene_type:complete